MGILNEVVPGQVWTAGQTMTAMGIPLGRRCAVVRDGAGRLVVFSPLPATTATVAALRTLGEVTAFVVPNRMHDRFYDGYFGEFPAARFFAGRAVRVDHPDWPLTELAPGAPELAGFEWVRLAGMPRLEEDVHWHRASRTVIVADAFFNVPRTRRPAQALLMWLADIGGPPPRPSRLFRLLVRDRPALVASVRRILEFDFDRIVPGHGEPILQHGWKAFRAAFAAYLD